MACSVPSCGLSPFCRGPLRGPSLQTGLSFSSVGGGAAAHEPSQKEPPRTQDSVELLKCWSYQMSTLSVRPSVPRPPPPTAEQGLPEPLASTHKPPGGGGGAVCFSLYYPRELYVFLVQTSASLSQKQPCLCPHTPQSPPAPPASGREQEHQGAFESLLKVPQSRAF